MKKYILFISLFFITFAAVSQEEEFVPVSDSFTIKQSTISAIIIDSLVVTKTSYRLKAGFAIGGTSPFPLPAEIREIKGFNPLMNLMIGAEVQHHLDKNWSLLTGLQFETKGMETQARVKSYNLTMTSGDEGEISGVFTGMVRTRIKNSYLTLPVSALWRPYGKKWGIKAGLYGSFLLDSEFSGSAYDGYLREGEPTGEKIEITTASYEFSNEMQKWNWGFLLGAEWQPFRHLLTGIDLSWGINSIFKKDFDVITFDMYPIYATISFGYVF